MIAWVAVLIACWRLRRRNAQQLQGLAEHRQSSVYADIEDVIDCLDDIAKARNWDLAKL